MTSIVSTPPSLRINFLNTPVNLNGGQRVTSIYARLLQQRGHQVCIISPNHRPMSLRQKIKFALKHHRWPITGKHPSYFDGLACKHITLDTDRPILDTDVPDGDIVIATWWATAEWAMALSPSKGKKVYFIQHHEVHDYLPVERSRQTYLLPLHKIVIARWLYTLMQDTYHDNTVDLVPNSVDHQQFFAPIRAKQDRPTVGFLYSSSGYKGVAITLKAIKKLSLLFPELRIISFGSNPVSNESDWLSTIEFHLRPAQDQIRHLYDQCDVWLTASRSEGFNLPAMEAMACRTPVVSTRTGWPEEAVVDGHNGFLINIDDVDGMVQAATTILSSTNQQWQQFSANAFATVEHSSWEASATLFEQALFHALSRQDLQP